MSKPWPGAVSAIIMNDTLSAKELVMSTIGATQLPGTARTYARVQAKKDTESLRRSSHISSLSPTDIRIAHQAPSGDKGVTRSLFAVDQKLTRLDTLNNPIGEDTITVAFQMTKTKGATLAEVRTAVSVLLGALLETDGALVSAVYNQET